MSRPLILAFCAPGDRERLTIGPIIIVDPSVKDVRRVTVPHILLGVGAAGCA